MISRRRFLAISATALACPVPAHAAEWQGHGFGAALSIRLDGADPARAALIFSRVESEIARIEARFSLFTDSSLTRLNRDGRLAGPGTAFADILELASRVHVATGGAFDPTVQPLWLALAQGEDPGPAHRLIGFNRIALTPDEIRLAPGQALTLNGIAQGWGADRIAAVLRDAGYTSALIDMGEIASLGPTANGTPWPVSIAGVDGRTLAAVPLAGRALATSSPAGTLIGTGQSHILGPKGQPPLWNTVSISAASAAVADALSTACCLLDRPAIQQALAAFPDARIEALI